MPKPKQKQIATCVGCGCTDDKGCPVNEEGYSCSWIEVDYDAKVGICCRCVTQDNSHKFKLAVSMNQVVVASKTIKEHMQKLNRREFLSSERRREGRCE